MVRVPTHGRPTHPGEMILEEFLKPLGMTQTEFAQRIDVAWTRANQIIRGKRGVTPDTALRLEKLFRLAGELLADLAAAVGSVSRHAFADGQSDRQDPPRPGHREAGEERVNTVVPLSGQ